jgi:hypothetical protein
VKVIFWFIGALGFEWFSPYYSYVFYLLILNFLLIVSSIGYRLVKPNH